MVKQSSWTKWHGKEFILKALPGTTDTGSSLEKSSMKSIVIDKDIPNLKGVFEKYCDVTYLKGQMIDRKAVKNADALIIRTRTKASRELLENSSIKFIATATAGFDHIDTEFCKSEGIRWAHAPGCNSFSVMQYLAAALAHLSEKHNFKFGEKTLGIIGVGHVGAKVAKMARILGFRVLLNDPPRTRKEGMKEFVALETILKESDLVSLHVPLNLIGQDKTLGLCNEDFISGLKKGAIVINTSRGEVVMEKALIKAIKSGHIGGAVLDVWEGEPDINPDMVRLVDIATPHIAGYSADGKALGSSMVVQALSRYFKLGLDKWQAKNLIGTDNMEIGFDENQSRNPLGHAIFSTYPIMKDHEPFVKDISKFEYLRNNYPVRREFPAYTINPSMLARETISKLYALGFRTY